MDKGKLLGVCLLFFVSSMIGAQEEEKEEKHEPGLNEKTFEGLELRNLGPALMSGRVADIAKHPTDKSVWYVAVGSGGVWKTVNAGTTWEPIFDDQSSYSIGCVTIDPTRPDTVWVGTGENVGGRHAGYGDGVYRSLDGGKNWKQMGLKESEHIGNIIVHPEDSDTVYVAAQGPLWSGGGDRGLYKTTDGGENWQPILKQGDFTGVNEVRMDPRDPDVLFAATHQRLRSVAVLVNGGPESSIQKSTDGGNTWRKLSKGLPEEDMGKIGLALSPQKPDVIYATIELANRSGGFWRSEDGGESWEKRSDYLSSATGPHYYQEIVASPHVFDRVYQMDSRLHVTHDGGKNFVNVGADDHKHVDHHALVFDLDDENYLMVGTDGGLYETWDLGVSWKFIANLPVTQFYKVAVDYDEPFYNIYGGTQDNNTQGGPSRTDNAHGIRNSDWFVTLFGDGHQPAVDPTNPDIVYSEWQEGNLVRYDRKTGEIVYIQPQPGPKEPSERFNWDSPILISPHDPKRLFYASQRVWRSDDRGDSWRPISQDLSKGIDRLTQPIMGRVWSYDSAWDIYAMSKYGNVTSLSESPLVDGLLYAGTDDGLVQISEDGGDSWSKVDKLPGVAAFFFVNDIKADLHDRDTVYVVVDDHKTGDFSPYILKSTNRGKSWRNISGDLPKRHVVWRLVQDHVNPNLLFAGTEFGVFFTIDSGKKWVKLSGGTPTISFRDLVIQKRENDLVGASFGRGFFVLDDYSPLRNVTEDMLQQEATLFPVRDTQWYLQRRPLGFGEKGSQGLSYYTAPNPPFGAVFTYYLKDKLKSRQEARRESEKKLEKEGGNTPYPGWDALRREELEEEPGIVFTVRNDAGELVRRISGDREAGFHRVAWDLRYPNLEPWSEEEADEYIPTFGVLAVPGRYTVIMEKRVGGKFVQLGEPQSFNVTSIRKPVLPGSPPEQTIAFAKRVDELQRGVKGAARGVEEILIQLDAIQTSLMNSTADSSLEVEAFAIEQRLKSLQQTLVGNERRGFMNDPGPMSITSRIDVAALNKVFTAYGPTPTHIQSIEIAEAQFSDVRDGLNQILDTELPELEKKLNQAGVPWTPGRGVPVD